MPDVGISLEALLVLLFFVFAIPFTSCAMFIGSGLIRGYRIRRAHQRFARAYERRLFS
jgi:hypothetical protein